MTKGWEGAGGIDKILSKAIHKQKKEKGREVYQYIRGMKLNIYTADSRESHICESNITSESAYSAGTIFR